MRFNLECAEKLLPELMERLGAASPDYLLTDVMCVWGNLLAQKLDAPAVSFSTTFVTNPETPRDVLVNAAYGQAPAEVLLAGLVDLEGYFRLAQQVDQTWQMSCPDIVQFFANHQGLNVVLTSREFHIYNETFDDSYVFCGPSFGGRLARDDFPWDRLDDRPLVYISLGTIFNQQTAFYRACAEALANSAYQVVLSSGAAGLESPPPGWIVRDRVPQLQLLERAGVFLTHGGMNSTQEALWRGVPMAFAPQHGDQFLVAARAAELGAGVVLPPAAGSEHIRAVIDDLFGDRRYAAGARTLGDQLRAAGGGERAATAILSHVQAEEIQ